MSDHTDAARSRGAAWHDHITDDAAPVDRVLSRYGERHRRYHGVIHVDTVLRFAIELGTREGLPSDAVRLVVAAALYHDAIYEPRSRNNEAASARLARRDLSKLGWPSERTDSVAHMIEGTAAHLDPPDVATATLFDADLSVLGAAPDEYERYRVAVRQEYHHVSDDDWTTGRAQVLEGFLDRSKIFTTGTANTRWEETARRNIADELAALTT